VRFLNLRLARVPFFLLAPLTLLFQLCCTLLINNFSAVFDNLTGLRASRRASGILRDSRCPSGGKECGMNGKPLTLGSVGGG